MSFHISVHNISSNKNVTPKKTDSKTVRTVQPSDRSTVTDRPNNGGRPSLPAFLAVRPTGLFSPTKASKPSDRLNRPSKPSGLTDPRP
ncbi:hypothetical protein BpHYR1_040175 [Brachionus plicatilis]|uniref:Uncharacterized protein n=1 Tax=Brachionus plicatilis TaxID=10195 RepID=A0A3M7PLL4_BRAPC|nr:hypothetical protein BpHYR1_040175 [Brachionus plicatilis]